MVDRRIFSNRQWLAALGAALALHLLLAWPLLPGKPVPAGTPAVQDGGRTVNTLFMSGGAVPILRDSAAFGNELTMVTAAAPPSMPLHAVVPPAPQPMTEMVPRQEPARDQNGPKSRAKRTKPERIEPKRKGPGVPKARQETRSRGEAGGKTAGTSDRDRQAEAARGRTDRARDRNAGQGGTARRGAVDRVAAPVAGNPRPPYPPSARSRGQEGRVLIRVSVLGSGRVGSVTVASSSGHGSLDRAALKTIKRWRFRPALRAGKPVTATVTVPVTFRLEG